MQKIIFSACLLLTCLTAAAQSWSPLVSGTNRNLHDVYIADDQTVYAITSAFYGDNDWAYQDILLRSFDDGSSWDSMPLPGLFAQKLFFLNDSVGFISGGMPSCGIAATVAKTTDKGVNWTGWQSQNTWNVPMTVGYGYSAAYFWEADKGYVFGGNWLGEQHKTLDNGASWQKVRDFRSYNDFPSIFFWNEMEGYVIADSTHIVYDSLGQVIAQNSTGSLYKTVNAGNSWTEHTFPNDKLSDIHFPSQTVGYLAAGTHLWKSTDAGQNWTSISLPFFVTKIAFVNAQLGYALSEDGDIYKTIDGASNWILDHSGDFLAISVKKGRGFAVGENGSMVRLGSGTSSIGNGGADNGFQLFPNPAQDYLYLSVPENMSFSVQIHNALGQVLIETKAETRLAINVSALAKQATYFVVIKNEQGEVLRMEKLLK